MSAKDVTERAFRHSWVLRCVVASIRSERRGRAASTAPAVAIHEPAAGANSVTPALMVPTIASMTKYVAAQSASGAAMRSLVTRSLAGVHVGPKRFIRLRYGV